jgi:hypothetical protein
MQENMFILVPEPGEKGYTANQPRTHSHKSIMHNPNRENTLFEIAYILNSTWPARLYPLLYLLYSRNLVHLDSNQTTAQGLAHSKIPNLWSLEIVL